MSTLANERVAWFNGKIVPEHEVRSHSAIQAGSTATVPST